MEKYEDLEIKRKINTGTSYYYQYDLVNYMIEWCEGDSELIAKAILSRLKYDECIFIGEFIKAILKINNIVKEIEYPDHYEYSQNELDTLANLEKQYNASLITTEKDYLRINKIFRKRVSFLPIKVEFKEQNYANEIKKFIL